MSIFTPPERPIRESFASTVASREKELANEGRRAREEAARVAAEAARAEAAANSTGDYDDPLTPVKRMSRARRLGTIAAAGVAVVCVATVAFLRAQELHDYNSVKEMRDDAKTAGVEVEIDDEGCLAIEIGDGQNLRFIAGKMGNGTEANTDRIEDGLVLAHDNTSNVKPGDDITYCPGPDVADL